MPRVLNKYTCTAEERRNAVNCMRGSPYGNPYIIGRDGDRDRVCDLYRDRVLPDLDVSALKGRDLLCCCKPKRCHVDDIFFKANGYRDATR